MDVVVLVPRRPEPWRDQLWRCARRQLEAEVEWPVLEGLSIDGPFNRSLAVNLAAGKLPWDVAVVLDADTIPDFDNLRIAVAIAAERAELVLPHTAFRSLTRRATKAVLAGKAAPAESEARWVTRETKSSCLCIGRDLWQRVGGFDPAFLGWGFEDAAFFAACRELGGIQRLDGEVVHLWHPRSPEKDIASPEYVANRERAARYKQARGAEAMAALLEELRS